MVSREVFSNDERGARLLYALNAASASLQKSARSEEEVFRAVCEQIQRMGLRGGLSLLDESGTRLTVRAVVFPHPVIKKLEEMLKLSTVGYSFEVAQVDVYQRVVATGMTQFTQQSGETVLQLLPKTARRFGGMLLKSLGSHPAIYAPIRCEGKIRGVLNIAGEELSQHDVPAMEAFANHVGIALENAHLFEQVVKDRRHLRLLYDISRELTTSQDDQQILDRAVALTCQALDGVAGVAYLYLPDERILKLGALYARPPISTHTMEDRVIFHLGEGLTGWVAENLQPAYIPDVCQDHRWLYVAGIDEGVRSALSAPITVGDQLLGVLSVLRLQPEGFSTENIELLQAICREIGLALSNARRYQQIKRRLTEIHLIQSVTQVFNQRLELQQLLDEVVQQLAQRFGYPQVEIFLVEGDRLFQRARLSTPPMPEGFPFSQGIVGRVARTGEAALVLDVSQDPDYYANIEDTVAELAVPVFHGRIVVGVINIETNVRGQLTTQDLDLLQVLAGQIAIALENAVLYERIRRHAEELEQTVARRTSELSELYELSQKSDMPLLSMD